MTAPDAQPAKALREPSRSAVPGRTRLRLRRSWRTLPESQPNGSRPIRTTSRQCRLASNPILV